MGRSLINDPDQKLIEQAKTGNKAAFGKLVDQYYQMVYAVAYGVLGNREESLDLAQDLFLKVFRQLGDFHGDSKFKTWIYRIAVNMAIDVTRKRKPSVSIDGDEIPIVEKKPGPRDEMAKGELADLVSQALAELSPEHRAILVLREWQDLSYDEIAEMLKLELGTVMSRIHYARKKLGEIISKRFGKVAI